MIALTSPYLWYTTRATGLVSLALFTVVVSLGTLVANRVGGSTVGRFELSELHRTISVIAMVFLAVHVATTVVDSFVSTGAISVVVPFTSSYRRWGVGLGAVAVDLMIAVWISSLVKSRIANRSWRFIHWFSWFAYAIAIVHALLTGTDARRGLGLVIVVASLAIVAGAAVWRFTARPTRAAGRTALSPLSETERNPRRGGRPVVPVPSGARGAGDASRERARTRRSDESRR